MSLLELESFVKKFQHLWSSGIDAHLHVETHAGHAWVHLQVRLGQAPDPPTHQLGRNFPPKQRNSTSRQRRRARRESERREKAKVAGKEVTENQQNVIEKDDEMSINNISRNKSDLHEKQAGEATVDHVEDVENQSGAEKATTIDFENEIDIVPCENCTKSFAFHKEVKENMCDECIICIAQREQIDLPNKYQCTVCKNVFKTKTLFRLHTNCSFGSDSLVYICESCNQVWTDEETFENHMKMKHMIHVCVRCNARLEGKISLDAHFRAKHRAF